MPRCHRPAHRSASRDASLFLDIHNVTDRAKVEGRKYNYNYSEYENVTGLPLIPSFGLSYTPLGAGDDGTP